MVQIHVCPLQIALANRKKKEERLRKNPPPLPRVLVEMLRREHGIINGRPDPMRADETGKGFARDDVFLEYLYCYPRCVGIHNQ